MESAPLIGYLMSGCGLLENLEKFLLKSGKIDETHAAVNKRTVLEEEYCRDVADAVCAGDLIVLINVELADHCLVGILVCEFLYDGTEFDAGTAPCGPEINYYYLT